jgi:enamine deaminase RidA (YjgF/YER057c/UK114 family)
MFLCEVSQVQQAYEPIRARVLFDPALIAVLDAYRREAAGFPSGSEVIREAVRPTYAEWAGASRPARAVVPVPCLHYGFQIEVEAIAVQ